MANHWQAQRTKERNFIKVKEEVGQAGINTMSIGGNWELEVQWLPIEGVMVVSHRLSLLLGAGKTFIPPAGAVE